MRKLGSKQDIITTEPYKKAQKEIEKLLKLGWSVYEIYATTLVELPDMIDDNFRRMVRRAYEHAKITIHRNREFVFKEHMARYERIYRTAIEEAQALDPKKDWSIIVSKYSSALKALKSKEELLGLHNKDVVIEIDEDSALMHKVPTKQGFLPFKIQELNFEEMKELLSLLKESKISEEDGVRKLIVKQHKPAVLIPEPVIEEAVDTIYEEMPTKIVDQLQAMVIAEESRLEPLEQLNVVDKRGGLRPTGENIDTVKGKISDNLKRQFEEILKGKK